MTAERDDVLGSLVEKWRYLAIPGQFLQRHLLRRTSVQRWQAYYELEAMEPEELSRLSPMDHSRAPPCLPAFSNLSRMDPVPSPPSKDAWGPSTVRALSGLYPNEISQFAQPHLVFAAPQSSASLAAAYYQLWTGLQAEGITALLLDVCGGWHEDSLKLLLVAQELGGEEGEDAEQVLLGYFIPMDSRRLPAADCTQPAVHAAVCERRRLRRRQQVQQQQQQKPQEAQVVHDQQLTCTPQEPHCVLVPPGCELQQLRAIQQQQQQQHTAWLPALDSCCQAADAELTRGGEVTRAAQGAGNRQRHGGVEEEEPNAADEQGELQEACARVKAAVLDRVRALSRSHRRVLSQMPGWWLAWQDYLGGNMRLSALSAPSGLPARELGRLRMAPHLHLRQAVVPFAYTTHNYECADAAALLGYHSMTSGGQSNQSLAHQWCGAAAGGYMFKHTGRSSGPVWGDDGLKCLIRQDLPTGFAKDMCSCDAEHCEKLPGRQAVARLRAEGLQHSMEIFERSCGAGWGVRAVEEPIPAGAYVMEYVGEYLTLKHIKAEEREQRYGLAGWHYMFDVHNPELTDPPPSKQLVVDATHMGNVSRFVNHSCDPNCAVVHVCFGSRSIESKMVLLFKTLRKIAPGEELTIAYMSLEDFERNGLRDFMVKNADHPAIIKCNCGAASCRGMVLCENVWASEEEEHLFKSPARAEQESKTCKKDSSESQRPTTKYGGGSSEEAALQGRTDCKRQRWEGYSECLHGQVGAFTSIQDVSQETQAGVQQQQQQQQHHQVAVPRQTSCWRGRSL